MCDFNNDMMCTWPTFSSSWGSTSGEPTLGDFDDDGDNDFQDFRNLRPGELAQAR
jgi:hypothetical protein